MEYKFIVIEKRDVFCEYTVDAVNEEEARYFAEIGETEEECEVDGDYEVVDRYIVRQVESEEEAQA
jgi:hypothetical protein